jgi:hypothetical protein
MDGILIGENKIGSLITDKQKLNHLCFENDPSIRVDNEKTQIAVEMITPPL